MELYMHKIKVAPKGCDVIDFPIDMLRHDALMPRSEADSRKIQRSFALSRAFHNTCVSSHLPQPFLGMLDVVKDGNIRNDFCIELWCQASKDWVPSEARWESFLWKVVEHQMIVGT